MHVSCGHKSVTIFNLMLSVDRKVTNHYFLNDLIQMQSIDMTQNLLMNFVILMKILENILN